MAQSLNRYLGEREAPPLNHFNDRTPVTPGRC